jgi:hypothetical protein
MLTFIILTLHNLVSLSLCMTEPVRKRSSHVPPSPLNQSWRRGRVEWTLISQLIEPRDMRPVRLMCLVFRCGLARSLVRSYDQVTVENIQIHHITNSVEFWISMQSCKIDTFQYWGDHCHKLLKINFYSEPLLANIEAVCVKLTVCDFFNSPHTNVWQRQSQELHGTNKTFTHRLVSYGKMLFKGLLLIVVQCVLRLRSSLR